jgi:conjugative transfer region protein TrbK
MRGPLFAIVFVALSLAGCALSLRGADGDASVTHSDAALDGRLVRCSALGTAAHDDPDCIKAFAEARSRILSASPEN